MFKNGDRTVPVPRKQLTMRMYPLILIQKRGSIFLYQAFCIGVHPIEVSRANCDEDNYVLLVLGKYSY